MEEEGGGDMSNNISTRQLGPEVICHLTTVSGMAVAYIGHGTRELRLCASV